MVDIEGDSSEASVSDETLPEVEAGMINDKSIHIRVRCSKRKGILAGLLAKVESLNMTTVNVNVIPVRDPELLHHDIVIIALVEDGFNVPTVEVTNILRQVLRDGA